MNNIKSQNNNAEVKNVPPDTNITFVTLPYIRNITPRLIHLFHSTSNSKFAITGKYS